MWEIGELQMRAPQSSGSACSTNHESPPSIYLGLVYMALFAVSGQRLEGGESGQKFDN